MKISNTRTIDYDLTGAANLASNRDTRRDSIRMNVAKLNRPGTLRTITR